MAGYYGLPEQTSGRELTIAVPRSRMRQMDGILFLSKTGLGGGGLYIYGEPMRSDLCPIEQMCTLLDFLVHLFQQMPLSTHLTENRKNNERKTIKLVE
jgi:hypothetical protein